jgi:hypothetical protein
MEKLELGRQEISLTLVELKVLIISLLAKTGLKSHE